MAKNFIAKVSFGLALLLLINAAASDTASGLTMSGFGSMESGQLHNWRYKGQDFDRQWMMRDFTNITGTYTVNSHFKVSAGLTTKLYYDTYQQEVIFVAYTPKRQQLSIYPSVAEGVFNFNFGDDYKFLFELGYFPYKYNPDSRNLGEYLFRSGTYPPTVFTDIDGSFQRLTGTHLSCKLFDMFTLHGFLTQENQYPSFFDFSLTGLAEFNYKNIISVGAGIMGCRIISVDDSVTSRKDDAANMYTDSTLPNNTGYYTFAGTKAMARISLDPKPLANMIFGNWDRAGILGKEDCKIYGEIAMLGIKNYPVYYADSMKRVPRMVGFNWPTYEFLSYGFIPGALGYSLVRTSNSNLRLTRGLAYEAGGLLFGTAAWLAHKYLNFNLRPDICAFEVEFYPWDWPNNPENVIYNGEAIPGTIGSVGQAQYTLKDYSNDNWKWSLYMRKVFYQHFSVLVQFANDHLMLPSYDGKYNQSEEVLGRNYSWYWVVKLGFLF